MITLASLMVLCAIAIGALVVVSLVNRQQAVARQRRQRMRSLKFRVDALEEMAIALDQVVDNRVIAKRVYDEALTLLESMRKLDPTAAYLDAIVTHVARRAEEFADQHGPRIICRLKESDAQIARTQQALNEAGRLLRQQQLRGLLSQAELESHINELSWIHLYVEVISLIGRGMVAMERGDVMGAFAFYKRAQSCLLQSNHNDPRRQQLVKELNEMLGKRRMHPSDNVMPEAKAIQRELANQPKAIAAGAGNDELSNTSLPLQ